MNKINVKFIKLHESAKLPSQAHDNDTGYDLYSIEDVIITAKGSANVDTGMQVAYIEPGYWFRIEGRSGLGFKYGITPHFGVIDEGYVGKLGTKLYNFSNNDYKISKGDRIAQIIFYPLIKANLYWTENISQTTRGETGFGSSGI